MPWKDVSSTHTHTFLPLEKLSVIFFIRQAPNGISLGQRDLLEKGGGVLVENHFFRASGNLDGDCLD